MTKLSVIVPCYNCAATLFDAVVSIYSQDVGIPFDVTMVDDGSTDTTYDVMKQLAAQHSNIRLVRHTSNQGGGAARNTAVEESDGDLIFCLDADDMLGPDLLNKLTRFWLMKRCDAVGVSRSVKFRNSNVEDVAYVTEFAGPGERIRFESLLDGTACSLTSTFLMTCKAFALVGGYPMSHGFDTQGMAFRFLGNGLEAYTCPDTVYYHRVEFNDSYYLREQKAGRINWNWLQVLDEFIYLFNPATQRQILESRLFSPPGEPAAPDLLGYVRDSQNIYARNYRSLIRLGWNGVADRFKNSRDKTRQYWLGTHCSRRGDHPAAIAHYTRALELGFDFRIIYYRILEASLRLSGSQIPTGTRLAELLRYCQPVSERPLTLGQRLFHGLMRNDILRAPAVWAKAQRDALVRGRNHA